MFKPWFGFLVLFSLAFGLAAIGCQRHRNLETDGGIRLIYRADPGKLTALQKQNLPRLLRTEVAEVLGNRAMGPLKVDHPKIFVNGSNQVVVELPGLTDIDAAKRTIGSNARIGFYWAKTVRTARRNWEPYSPIFSQVDDPGVSFEDNVSHDTIKAPDPAHPNPLNDQRYAQMIKGWDLILSGGDIGFAQPMVGGTSGSSYIPALRFTPEGADKMAAWCRHHQNEGAQLACVFDGRVLSVAGLMNNTVLSGNAVIEGSFSAKFVMNLCAMINDGSLPVDLVLVRAEKFPSHAP